MFRILPVMVLIMALEANAETDPLLPEHQVPREHPRLLGSLDRLRRLAKVRPGAYARLVQTARKGTGSDHLDVVSLSLVSAIEGDGEAGRKAVDMVMKLVNGPIRSGHVPFASDLAHAGIVYDLCHQYWTEEERDAFHSYLDRTKDANVKSEPSVFHNGWYGYKHWGIGVASYASYYENPRSREHLEDLYRDYSERAAPALNLAGNGGGWAEGHYINYWNYYWLFFCEVARFCEGRNLYETAPLFYRNRAAAAMFECYPPVLEHDSRRSIPMGDGGGQGFGGFRDQMLCVRRMLCSRYRDDPVHQVVQAFNEQTPRVGVSVAGYMDFLWHDTEVPVGDLEHFRLSHISEGPGYVYARSSWREDATYFFFKCGDRFTSHQHLDNGHFLIFKHEELAGDGGQYDSFGSLHDVNYHLRSIAHSTVLVHDPSETWKTYGNGGIRAGKVTSNDGGQHHDFPHHNGDYRDVRTFNSQRTSNDIGDIVAFEDQGAYLYAAGDCTRSYRSNKVSLFTRQVVYLRPDTFVIFDRVASKNAGFRKTWVLQAMKKPEGEPPNLVITNGRGRLFVQTLLPEKPAARLVSGDELYSIDGRNYPLERRRGAVPECRVEISPSIPATAECFLHVLTAKDASVGAVPSARLQKEGSSVSVVIGPVRVKFLTASLGGSVVLSGKEFPLAGRVYPDEPPVKTLREAEPAEPRENNAVPPTPAPPEEEQPEEAIDPQAARLFRDARTAERGGMKDLAKALYEQIIRDFPDGPIAEKARERLK